MVLSSKEFMVHDRVVWVDRRVDSPCDSGVVGWGWGSSAGWERTADWSEAELECEVERSVSPRVTLTLATHALGTCGTDGWARRGNGPGTSSLALVLFAFVQVAVLNMMVIPTASETKTPSHSIWLARNYTTQNKIPSTPTITNTLIDRVSLPSSNSSC